jgi:hypothetical protein
MTAAVLLSFEVDGQRYELATRDDVESLFSEATWPTSNYARRVRRKIVELLLDRAFPSEAPPSPPDRLTDKIAGRELAAAIAGRAAVRGSKSDADWTSGRKRAVIPINSAHPRIPPMMPGERFDITVDAFGMSTGSVLRPDRLVVSEVSRMCVIDLLTIDNRDQLGGRKLLGDDLRGPIPECEIEWSAMITRKTVLRVAGTQGAVLKPEHFFAGLLVTELPLPEDLK